MKNNIVKVLACAGLPAAITDESTGDKYERKKNSGTVSGNRLYL